MYNYNEFGKKICCWRIGAKKRMFISDVFDYKPLNEIIA